MEIKNKQLELDENKQIIDMLESGDSDNFKKEKAQLDRDSRKELKSMDALSKLAVEEEKQESENNRTRERLLNDIVIDIKKNKKDMDTKNLEALVNLTIAKYNKEKM